ncbi:hypothetical protein GCM10023188_05620 [Pontibacter saemangeumensis]|uniref:Uncharacterized protein n=1 Tax=Pontibacter saemangeumensis TaxID=1084525 RepID=A0ABP8L8X9_9BACT
MKYYILSHGGGQHGESGEPCETEYSFHHACCACGTGAEIKHNLKARGIAKTKKDLFETKDGDLILSKNFYKRVKEKLPEFELLQVVDTKNNPLGFYHLYANETLPKFKESSTGYVTEGQCPVCHRDGYFNDVIVGKLAGTPTIIEPVVLRYEYKDINKLSNSLLMKSWECVGLSNKVKVDNRVVRFARPLTVVVREDLKEVLEDEKIKATYFEPIIIEGSVQQKL